MPTSTLIDNSANLKMVSTLKECIMDSDIDTIRIATGYWDIPGMALLKDELRQFLCRKGTQLKMIIGKDPFVYANMVRSPKYRNTQYPQDFIRTNINDLVDNLKDEYKDIIDLLLEYCDEDNKKIEIHIFKKDENDETQFFHSKCYIFTNKNNSPAYGIIGSSNFTEKGLQGNSELNYLETNPLIITYPSTSTSTIKGHVGWFEEKWAQSEDWTKEFLEQVLKPSKPVQIIETEKKKKAEALTPYELYIKLLQYNFGDLLDVDTSQVISDYLPNDYIRLDYQIDAVKQCFSIMRNHGGFMLADVVGLGKTIVGCLVIKHFINHPDDDRERKVLIVTPPAIKSAWTGTIEEFDKDRTDQISPYIDFITTGSIGKLVDVEDEEDFETDSGEFIEELNHNNYGLILIDESHKFRNSNTRMYQMLDDLIAQIGANTGCYPYIGLLSATPQNNTPNDLKNQIYLFERNHSYSTLEKVDGRDLEKFFAKETTEFNNLRAEAAAINAIDEKTQSDLARLKEIDKELKAISKIIRDNVLNDILVRRTRTDIEKYYHDDIKQQHLVFPKISGPHSLKYIMDDQLAELFFDTMNLIAPSPEFKFDNSDYLCYYRYRAIQFLNKEEDRAKYKGRGSRDADDISKQLARIMQMLLVKRLESSFTAFTQSLQNLRTYTKNMIDMWEHDTIFVCPQIDVNAELDIAAKTNKRKRKITYSDCVEDLRAKIKKLNDEDRNERGQNAEYKRSDFSESYFELLKADYDLISDLCDRWGANSEDPKLDTFKESLKNVLFNPKKNKPQKLVIFTEAIDTVNALTRACKNKGYSVLAITAQNRKEQEDNIRANFDANYRGDWRNDYQVIITTEVLAEGINLHRANVILNYDTPWNSTRLMQRIGRVNRIGSNEPFVYVYNFMPSAEGDKMINLVNTAHVKLQSFHTLFGEDSKIFTEDEEVTQYELNQIVNGEESPYERYIYQLKQYRDANPDRYAAICSKEDNLATAVAAEDGCCYFVVRTPRMHGLFVRVTPDGKGTLISGLDMYESFKTDPTAKAIALPEDWDKKASTAIRAVGQHLVRITSYRSKDKAATTAKGYIVELKKNKGLSEHSDELLNLSFQLVNKGNIDIIRIINAIGREVFNNQLSLFKLQQEDIDNILESRLNGIISTQTQKIGKPEIYIGIAK